MRTSHLLPAILLLAACSAQKGDPSRVEEYVAGLRESDLEARALAVENLIRVGAAALPALEQQTRGGKHRLAERIADRIQAPGRAPLVELQFLAPDAMLQQETKRKRLEKERYRPPAGHVWRPVDRDAWQAFGGQREILLVSSRRSWTDRTLLRIKPVPATGVEFHVLAPLEQEFGDFTAAGDGRRLAIVLRGAVVAAPVVKGRIDGRGNLDLEQDQAAFLLGAWRAAR